MNAGRELDAEVAEKVMGWVWYYWPIGGSLELARAIFDPNDTRPDKWKCLPWTEAIGDVRITDMEDRQPPPYSTNIAAAWEVVALLRGRGWNYVFHSNAYGGWKAVMYRPSEAETSAGAFELFYQLGNAQDHYRLHAEISALVTTDANTLPEAICLAALEAVDATAAEV